jgi:hypothetical protein
MSCMVADVVADELDQGHDRGTRHEPASRGELRGAPGSSQSRMNSAGRRGCEWQSCLPGANHSGQKAAPGHLPPKGDRRVPGEENVYHQTHVGMPLISVSSRIEFSKLKNAHQSPVT